MILYLYGETRVGENSYSGIFYAVSQRKKLYLLESNALRDIEKDISNGEVAIKFGLPRNTISSG